MNIDLNALQLTDAKYERKAEALKTAVAALVKAKEDGTVFKAEYKRLNNSIKSAYDSASDALNTSRREQNPESYAAEKEADLWAPYLMGGLKKYSRNFEKIRSQVGDPQQIADFITDWLEIAALVKETKALIVLGRAPSAKQIAKAKEREELEVKKASNSSGKTLETIKQLLDDLIEPNRDAVIAHFTASYIDGAERSVANIPERAEAINIKASTRSERSLYGNLRMETPYISVDHNELEYTLQRKINSYLRDNDIQFSKRWDDKLSITAAGITGEEVQKHFTLVSNYKELAAENAIKTYETMKANFIGKNQAKLEAIITIKADKADVTKVDLLHAKFTKNVIDGSLQIDFADGSGFEVNTKSKINYRWGTGYFFQYPTTFRNVVYPDGATSKRQSEAEMVKLWAVD